MTATIAPPAEQAVEAPVVQLAEPAQNRIAEITARLTTLPSDKLDAVYYYVNYLGDQEDDMAYVDRVMAEDEAKFATNPSASLTQQFGTVQLSAKVLNKIWADEEDDDWNDFPAVT